MKARYVVYWTLMLQGLALGLMQYDQSQSYAYNMGFLFGATLRCALIYASFILLPAWLLGRFRRSLNKKTDNRTTPRFEPRWLRRYRITMLVAFGAFSTLVLWTDHAAESMLSGSDSLLITAPELALRAGSLTVVFAAGLGVLFALYFAARRLLPSPSQPPS